MHQTLRITSYRMAFWHATQRARHEEGVIFDCIFCQYSEGVALMRDVAAFLSRMGFHVIDFDNRSFTIAYSQSAGSTSQSISTSPKGKDALFELISGNPLPTAR